MKTVSKMVGLNVVMAIVIVPSVAIFLGCLFPEIRGNLGIQIIMAVPTAVCLAVLTAGIFTDIIGCGGRAAAIVEAIVIIGVALVVAYGGTVRARAIFGATVKETIAIVGLTGLAISTGVVMSFIITASDRTPETNKCLDPS